MSARPNAELAYRVLDHIDANPDSWNQSTWYRQTDCGTSACFAGWTVALAGHRVDVDSEPEPDGNRYYAAIDGDRLLTISRAAAEDLGIAGLTRPCTLHADCGYSDAKLADALFDGANTREDLGRLVAEIFGPRPAAPLADEPDEDEGQEHCGNDCGGVYDDGERVEEPEECVCCPCCCDCLGCVYGPQDGMLLTAEQRAGIGVALDYDDVPPNAGSAS